jgi:hypothetical protein
MADEFQTLIPVFKITRCDNGNSFLAVNLDINISDLMSHLNTFVNVTDSEESEVGCGYVTFAYYLEASEIGPEYPELKVVGPCECTPCYKLTNCITNEEIFTTSNNIAFYYFNQQLYLEFNELEGVWYVEVEGKDPCDCNLYLTIKNSYTSCEEGNPPKYFKLTDCSTGEIKFSDNQFLLEFLGQYINIDECGGCFLVELTDRVPVSFSSVTIGQPYSSCDLCNSSFFMLVNCINEGNFFFTTSKLSNVSEYLGKNVKLNCYEDICWLVTSVYPGDVDFDNILEVEVSESFEECSECYASTIVPEPPVVYTQKPVTPTYTSPYCTLEYYINTTCTYATHQYNLTLTSKYGIKSCCDDISTKDLIKYHLLQLELINDLNYVCTPTCDCTCQ